LKFSRIAVSLKRLQLESKTDLTTIALVLEFIVGIFRVLSTSYLHGLKSARIAQLLFLLTTSKFFDSLSGIRVCSSERLVFLAIGFCNID